MAIYLKKILPEMMNFKLDAMLNGYDSRNWHSKAIKARINIENKR